MCDFHKIHLFSCWIRAVNVTFFYYNSVDLIYLSFAYNVKMVHLSCLCLELTATSRLLEPFVAVDTSFPL